MKKTIVLVCGGRDYADSVMVDMQLDRLHALHNFGMLIHGGAKGADAEADRWAKSRRIPVKAYPADWKALGKKAGPIRNQTMLEEGKPDWVVGFPGGAGTEDMLRRAKKAGVLISRVIVVG
jgi:hypothetical protein